MDFFLLTKIKDIADWASKESGTSYENYIQLFSEKIDEVF